MRRRLLQLGLAIIAVATFLHAPAAKALSGSDFNPGRIIDDNVFYNKDAMSVSDIQSFLQSKVPSCDTNHATANSNYQPPWTCLYQYYENPSTHANNIGSPGTIPSGAISAAQIIYNAAQNYSISPKVLLVLLQKEQALVTDSWPYPSQYRSATGYGCPDSSVCDSQYYGFYNQVWNAARQFRIYANNPGNYNYRAGQNNNILYNPNGACGYQTVYIQNQATAGLYIYTPYVPNAAALNNLYGTGDSCSSYGNRNFWRLYNDWFGSTYGVPYQWALVSQDYDNGSVNIGAGSSEYITVTARNTGNTTWTNSGSGRVLLGTAGPNDRSSGFYDSSWIASTRAATTQEASVAPGQTGTFRFKVKAPLGTGSYQERFNLLIEGVTWFNDPGMYFTFNVTPSYRWDQVSQTFSSGSSSMSPGDTQTVTVVAKNTGSQTWSKTTNPVRLATWNPSYRNSPFYDSSWPDTTRAALLQETSVAPGQNGTFVFTVKAPAQSGSYHERFNLVAEGAAWFEDPNIAVDLQVKGNYSWSIVSQNYSGSTQMSTGQTQTLTLVAKNTGDTTWHNTTFPVRLATWNPSYRSSAFYDSSWPTEYRAATLQESSVAPGQNGTFSFTIKAPGQAGAYQERFNLVAEGVSWMPDTGMYFYLNVTAPYYAWSIVSQSYSGGSPVMPRGTSQNLTLVAKNTGNTAWSNTNNPVRLATWNPSYRTSVFYDASWPSTVRAANLQESSVAPGQNGTFTFKINAPNTARVYQEYFNLVAEGAAWMPDTGMYFYLNVF